LGKKTEKGDIATSDSYIPFVNSGNMDVETSALCVNVVGDCQDMQLQSENGRPEVRNFFSVALKRIKNHSLSVGKIFPEIKVTKLAF
jgi:hypothetical protein